MPRITITLEYVLERVVCADPRNSESDVLACCSGDVDVTIYMSLERTHPISDDPTPMPHVHGTRFCGP